MGQKEEFSKFINKTKPGEKNKDVATLEAEALEKTKAYRFDLAFD